MQRTSPCSRNLLPAGHRSGEGVSSLLPYLAEALRSRLPPAFVPAVRPRVMPLGARRGARR